MLFRSYIIIELFFSFEVRAVLVPDTMRLGQLIYEINKKMIARQNNNLVSLGVTVQQALVIAYLDKSKDKKVTQRMIEIGLK